MEQKKEQAKAEYIRLKKQYLENTTGENWIAFCNAKILCKHLGVII